MIRDHGDLVEADFAFRGLDLRDMYRPGSGMTLRRLLVLIRALPPDSLTHSTLASEQEKSLTSAERLRERQAAYESKGGE